MRIVADTNILVSAAVSPRGVAARILILAAEGTIRLFVSPFILSEMEEVLGRPKIGFSLEQIRASLEAVKEVAKTVQPKVKVNVIAAENSDNRILECALAAEADVLVTGNMKDIRPLGKFRDIDIRTPREFLDEYFPEA